jgi:hypothetical protein
MKQKDLALVIIIAAISGGVSFAVSHFLFLTPQNRSQTVALVDRITTDFPTPDPKFFNGQSINPAKLIEIPNNTNNTNPFNGSGSSQ